MGGCPTNQTAPIKGVGSTRSKLRRIIRQLTYCVSKDKTLTNLKGGGGGLIDDGCDTRGSEVPKKNRSRLPIEELAEKRPALLEAPLAYLQVYLSDDRERNCQRSPMLYFALNQCSLTYRYICTKLQKLTLKAPMLRDSMANLIMLLQTMGRAYPETSEQIAGQLHKFIAILEDLDRQLAELSNLQPINWQSIIAIINSMVQEHIVNIDTRSFTEFIPSMDDFTESKLLGKGAFGAVYKAVLKSELDVAVKLVPQTKFHTGPTDGTPFMDKMIASMIPNHPCICRIYCAFVASYIVPGTSSNEQIMKSETCSKVENPMSVSVTVMEAIDGANLTELLKKNATLSFNLTQIIMQQCMMAIEHLHFSGFVHRDIKPANMMITFNGRLKLIDFDISRVCIGHFTNSFHVSYFCRTAIEFPGGEKAGTKAYMAPEVHQGKAFGRASDWWSVGIVHFRLAFGRLPFRNQQLVDQIINKRIEWDKFGRPGDTKQAVLKNYLTKLLVKEPRNRLGSQDYAHIFDHALFTDVNWQKLPEQEMRCEELDATFAERTSTINGKELLSMCPAGTTSKEDLLRLKNLADNCKEHVPLFTFASKYIKQLITGDPDVGDADDCPRWRHITDLKKSGDDTSGGTTMADNRQKRDPVQVIIQEIYGSNRMCMRQRRPITLRRLLSEDGMFRFLVGEIAAETKIVSDAKLYYGDLVLEIDKTSLTNLPEHRVSQLLAKKGAPLVLSVAQGNPFRDAGEATFNMSQLLFRYKPLKLTIRGTLKSSRCQCFKTAQIQHGFTLSLKKVYSTGSVELVWFVDSHEVSLQRTGTPAENHQANKKENAKDDKDTPNIYTGDIVLAINNVKLEQLVTEPDKNVLGLVGNMLMDIEILPCSPIRVSNLPRSPGNV